MTGSPLATFALVAYNQERYIREAVEGALAQTYEPLEIILSDDCSTDRTFEIMQRIASRYVGPHRLVVHRNPANLGLCGHVNSVFSLATADIVVLAAGDDVSLPGRVADTVEIFQRHPDVASVSLQIRYVDNSGRVLRSDRSSLGREGRFTLEDYARGDRAPGLGASRAYRRTLYTAFGPLSERCRAEDAALVFRALLMGTVWHSDRAGVSYRVHDRNLSYEIGASAVKSLFRQHLNDLRVATSRWGVPPDIAARTRQSLREMLARGVVLERFNRSRFKAWVLVRCILFSRRFSAQAKRDYARTALRQLAPLRTNLRGRSV